MLCVCHSVSCCPNFLLQRNLSLVRNRNLNQQMSGKDRRVRMDDIGQAGLLTEPQKRAVAGALARARTVEQSGLVKSGLVKKCSAPKTYFQYAQRGMASETLASLLQERERPDYGTSANFNRAVWCWLLAFKAAAANDHLATVSALLAALPALIKVGGWSVERVLDGPVVVTAVRWGSTAVAKAYGRQVMFNRPVYFGGIPLQFAEPPLLGTAVMRGDARMVRLLIKELRVDANERAGWPVLGGWRRPSNRAPHPAIAVATLNGMSRGRPLVRVLRALVQSKACVNAVCESSAEDAACRGRSALEIAAAGLDASAVATLLRCKADLTRTRYSGTNRKKTCPALQALCSVCPLQGVHTMPDAKKPKVAAVVMVVKRALEKAGESEWASLLPDHFQAFRCVEGGSR